MIVRLILRCDQIQRLIFFSRKETFNLLCLTLSWWEVSEDLYFFQRELTYYAPFFFGWVGHKQLFSYIGAKYSEDNRFQLQILNRFTSSARVLLADVWMKLKYR